MGRSWLFLEGVDPDEGRDHRDHRQEEDELDPYRQPHEPPGPAGPRADPTLGGLIAHLVASAPRVDGLLRHAHLDGQRTADVRAAIDPGHDEELDRPLQETLEDFARVRRRTVDLLHGWGKSEWDRTITDPRGGEMTLLEVCRLVARHEMGHIGQIRNLSALLPEPQDLGPPHPAGPNGK